MNNSKVSSFLMKTKNNGKIAKKEIIKYLSLLKLTFFINDFPLKFIVI
ncbi:MAG: hypothetical protein ACTSXD_02155 [Candidatus Heimdallarchaeaceae archaeon]